MILRGVLSWLEDKILTALAMIWVAFDFLKDLALLPLQWAFDLIFSAVFWLMDHGEESEARKEEK